MRFFTLLCQINFIHKCSSPHQFFRFELKSVSAGQLFVYINACFQNDF